MRSQTSVPLSFYITAAAGTGIYTLLFAGWFGAGPISFVLCVIGVPASIRMLARLFRERGSRSLVDRLLKAMGYAPDREPDKARDRARIVLTLACNARSENPSSMNDLLEVLKGGVIVEAFGADALSPLDWRDIRDVQLRCKALPPHVAERLLGDGWSWSPVPVVKGGTPD